MRRHLILIAVALLTACSYSTERTGATNDPATGLSKETRRCIEEHLLNGWSLNLAELSNDLTPEEESALDMAKDYCLNNSNSLKPPTSLDDQLQLPPQLLRAPSAFNSTDPPPGNDAELDLQWQMCGQGDAKACDELFYAAPEGSPYEQFAFSCGGRRNIDCSLLLGALQLEGELTPSTPSPGEDPNLDAWWDRCSNGSATACGELRLIAPTGSSYAQFASTCGARGTSYCALILEEEGRPPSLALLDPQQQPPGDDEFLDQLWLLCGQKDARACKDLVKYGPADSPYIRFGISCGGRAVAPCPRYFANLENEAP